MFASSEYSIHWIFLVALLLPYSTVDPESDKHKGTFLKENRAIRVTNLKTRAMISAHASR